MNKRITQKLKKNGRLDEMLRRYQARRGCAPSERLNERFAGEQDIKELYHKLYRLNPYELINPTISLLRYCSLNNKDQLIIQPAFFQEYFPGKKKISPEIALKIKSLLESEVKRLSFIS